jgi:hypothetical protein
MTCLPPERSLEVLIEVLLNGDRAVDISSIRIELIRLCMGLLPENESPRRKVEVSQLYAQLLRYLVLTRTFNSVTFLGDMGYIMIHTMFWLKSSTVLPSCSGKS